MCSSTSAVAGDSGPESSFGSMAPTSLRPAGAEAPLVRERSTVTWAIADRHQGDAKTSTSVGRCPVLGRFQPGTSGRGELRVWQSTMRGYPRVFTGARMAIRSKGKRWSAARASCRRGPASAPLCFHLASPIRLGARSRPQEQVGSDPPLEFLLGPRRARVASILWEGLPFRHCFGLPSLLVVVVIVVVRVVVE